MHPQTVLDWIAFGLLHRQIKEESVHLAVTDCFLKPDKKVGAMWIGSGYDSASCLDKEK